MFVLKKKKKCINLDMKLVLLTKQMMLILLGHEQLLGVLLHQNWVVDLLGIH